MDSLESIPGLLKCLRIRAQATLAVGIGSCAPWTFTNSGSGYFGCRNWFLGSLNVDKFGLRLHWLPKSITRLLKRLKIRTQATLAVGIDSWAPWTFTNSGSGYIGCRNGFLGSLNIYKFGLRLHWLSESIPGLLKRLQIRAQATLAVGIDSWAPWTLTNLGSACTVKLYIVGGICYSNTGLA
jgi:hypothetical protein